METVGDHACAVAEMRTLLDNHGLEVVVTHLQLDDLHNILPETIAFNQAIGNDTLVAPYIPYLVG